MPGALQSDGPRITPSSAVGERQAEELGPVEQCLDDAEWLAAALLADLREECRLVRRVPVVDDVEPLTITSIALSSRRSP